MLDDLQLGEYEPPKLITLGGLAEFTLGPCKPNPASHVPDDVWHYHCDDGSVVVFTSA